MFDFMITHSFTVNSRNEWCPCLHVFFFFVKCARGLAWTLVRCHGHSCVGMDTRVLAWTVSIGHALNEELSVLVASCGCVTVLAGIGGHRVV